MQARILSVLVLCAGALAGCASTDDSKAAVPAPEPTFELQGSRMIACCCGSPCPCRINAKPMQKHGCDHTDVVHIDSGRIGETRMDGVTYATVGRGFGENPDGTWVTVYLDERATPEQEAALAQWLTEGVEALGPKAAFLAGDFKGIHRVPLAYTISEDQREYTASIPGVLELHCKAHVNPGHSDPVVTTGVLDAFGDRFVHADTLAHRYEDAELGYEWDLTGRQANWAAFELDSEKAKRGGGWGCWTAHSSLGDTGQYQEEMIRDDESLE